VIDSMINDGLWDSFDQAHMGNTGELIAAEFHVTRPMQDEYALESHRKAAAATAGGQLRDEMLPIAIPQRRGDPITVDRDESIREDTSLEALSALRPAFVSDGTVTAGNAPPVNDGASAVVVMAEERASALGLTPMARIVGHATSGLAPRYVLM